MQSPTISAGSAPVNEIWKPIPGFEGCYEISSRGNILSLIGPRGIPRAEPRLVQPKVGRGGYWSVSLQRGDVKRGFYVHRLVAQVFIGPCPDGHEVNHIDGNRLNARAENLEYVTPGENAKHAYRIGNRDARGEGNGQAKLTAELVRQILAAVDGGAGQREVAQQFNVRQATVSDIVTGRCWSSVTGRTYQRKGRRPAAKSSSECGQ